MRTLSGPPSEAGLKPGRQHVAYYLNHVLLYSNTLSTLADYYSSTGVCMSNYLNLRLRGMGVLTLEYTPAGGLGLADMDSSTEKKYLCCFEDPSVSVNLT